MSSGATTQSYSPEVLPSRDKAQQLNDFLRALFSGFPWEIIITDWKGQTYSLGQKRPHWRQAPLEIHLHSQAAGRDLLAMNPLSFLERFVNAEVDMRGNLYLLGDVRDHLKLSLSFWQLVRQAVANRAFLFQNQSRARVNVKSHYDIPQEALNIYLDQAYMSYSCGMFEHPDRLRREELIRIGRGQADEFDSLEKAQWRKFKDAVDFIDPKSGESLLDVGCGYGGQLRVALENYPFGKVVGWTHSHNQVAEGRRRLTEFDKGKWELNEGDYREDNRVFDHVTSTGMISHVGPRGLIPYVRKVRQRIRKGGRYVHHALMSPFSKRPLDSAVGAAFNKKYVWPGFHWFTIGEHTKALEENGFEITKMVNLSPHYAKTTASWYERMMTNQETMMRNLGASTFRAWQIYLAPTSTGFRNRAVHVYRVYCTAV